MGTALTPTGVTFTDSTAQKTAVAPWASQRVLVAFGDTGTVTNISNQVNAFGVVSADMTGVGTSRTQPGSATYAGNRGIIAWGTTTYSNTISYSNLITDAGVVGTDVSTAGTARHAVAGTSYGGNKAIFGLGISSGAYVGVSNLVSSYGVIASDTTAVATARWGADSAPYGGDKGFFYGGQTASGYSAYYNLISNTGVVSSDTYAGAQHAQGQATSYGVDKAISTFDPAFGSVLYSYTISNTGVFTSAGATVAGIGSAGGGAGYGGDKGFIGFLYRGGYTNKTNLVSNTGVVAADVTNIATARYGVGATSFG